MTNDHGYPSKSTQLPKRRDTQQTQNNHRFFCQTRKSPFENFQSNVRLTSKIDHENTFSYTGYFLKLVLSTRTRVEYTLVYLRTFMLQNRTDLRYSIARKPLAAKDSVNQLLVTRNTRHVGYLIGKKFCELRQFNDKPGSCYIRPAGTSRKKYFTSRNLGTCVERC